MTTITLKIRNCDGCTIQPMLLRTDADGTDGGLHRHKVKVRDGVAVMKVPTDDTPGMSFLVDGPGTENIDALPVLVTQYKGYAPGTVVTRAQAKAAKKASGCWLGTSASSVTLRARAMTVRLPAFDRPARPRWSRPPGSSRPPTPWAASPRRRRASSPRRTAGGPATPGSPGSPGRRSSIGCVP